jgi:hypothetical protein
VNPRARARADQQEATMLSDTTATLEVARAGHDLRDALGDPAALALAADRLAAAAETSIDRPAPPAAAGVAFVPEDAADLLAAALSRLEVAGTLFAASEAVGEHGPARPDALDEPLRRLDTTVAMLGAPEAAPGLAATAAVRSASVPEAAAALEKQLGRTVEEIVGRSAKVIGGCLTGVHDRGPEAIRKAWDLVDEKLHLSEIGGKLASLGLRALRGALGMLAKLVPAQWLADLRERIDQLIATVDKSGPARTAVAMVLGAATPARLPADRSTLDSAKLDRGTGELAELATGYGKLMDLCGGIGTAIGLAGKVTVALRLAIPQLGVLILAAHVLVVGSVVVLGRDHIDAVATGTEDRHGLVRGVRTIVAEAAG